MARTEPKGFEGRTFRCNTGVICIYCPPGSVMKPNTGFENAVETVLGNIGSKASGQIVLDAVAAAEQPLFIVPQLPSGGAGTVSWSVEQATLAGEPIRTCNMGSGLKGQKPGVPIPGGGTGQGGGSPVAIYFTPGSHRGGVLPGSQQDEVLLHELLHAHRRLAGRQTCRPVAHNMDTIEEVFSIAVTNIYSSQHGRQLRRSHRVFDAMTDPAGWIKMLGNELRDLANDERILVNALRLRVGRAFWPFPQEPFRLE